MENINIKELFEKKQQQMLSDFGLASSLNHPVDKGDATEEEWRKWFATYFPHRYKVDKACIIDHEGNCSEQIDVVIYDEHFSPTIFEMNGKKYIPAESVYAVFEVKQELNLEHIQYAQKKIDSVKSLKRTSAPIKTITGYNSCKPNEILGGLLTFKSGWVHENIQQNIKKSILQTTKHKEQQLDFICCLSDFACAIQYIAEEGCFHGELIYMLKEVNIITDEENSPLIFTYFKLLRMLQNLGNAPAIDYSKYGINGI